MAKLYFRYGAMNCGKTTAMLQVAHNYEERGMNVVLLKPDTDTKGQDHIVSRLGVTRAVDYIVKKSENALDIIQNHSQNNKLGAVLVDESQFMTRKQINQLFKVAIELNTPVICYGLRTDFQTKVFPGAARLLEIAHSLEELKTICECGKKAIFNARVLNGAYTKMGDQVAIDGENKVTYQSLCGLCYATNVGPISNS